jgi:hypothetical protein
MKTVVRPSGGHPILDFGFWIGSALKGRSLKSDIFLIIPFKKGGLKPLFLVKGRRFRRRKSVLSPQYSEDYSL